MRAVVQRVKSSKVEVDNKVIGEIGKGINLFMDHHLQSLYGAMALKLTWTSERHKIKNIMTWKEYPSYNS